MYMNEYYHCIYNTDTVSIGYKQYPSGLRLQMFVLRSKIKLINVSYLVNILLNIH